MSNLGKARFVLVPGQSHGASFNPCAGKISLAFIADPTAPLALDCLASLRGADFSQADTAP